MPWDKVLQLLVVNRLLAPRSERFLHEKWFPQSSMNLLLDTDARVADSPRETKAGRQAGDGCPRRSHGARTGAIAGWTGCSSTTPPDNNTAPKNGRTASARPLIACTTS